MLTGIMANLEASTTVVALRQALLPRLEVLEAYLFGSTARAEVQPHSDIDVAVYIAEPVPESPGFGYEADLTAYLMQALRTNRVDLVLLNRAPPVLYQRVLRDGVRLLARVPHDTATRELRALSRYCDYVPQLAKIEAAHRARRAVGAFGR